MLAEQLRKAMKDSGKSLYAIAKKAELGYASVHDFYNGTSIDLKTADKIAKVVGVSFYYDED